MNAIKFTDKFSNQKITLKDANGLTLRHAEIFCQSIADAKNSEKFFNKGSVLIKDALKD
ncbi:MAG: hypothetical protein Q7K35_01390 [bacterium]|nr:hypothetical protein [bacterium]